MSEKDVTQSKNPIQLHAIEIDIGLESCSTSSTNTKVKKLPILIRLHAGHFRISLAISGQALLWKTLSTVPTTKGHPLRLLLRLLPQSAFTLLWFIALFSVLSLSVLYLIKCFKHFPAVKAEFCHHIGVNYFFVPWISWLLLLKSSPFITPDQTFYPVIWFVLCAPVVALDVKIYGQWFTKGKRFLSAVANPTNQLSVIGNFTAARVAAEMGWMESSICLFALGLVHYLVLFVTLYQRFPGFGQLPTSLRPVFFLFFAAPSMASLTWKSIAGSFDKPCKMFFFLSLFLFASLVARPYLFKKAMRKFHVAWWAYSFPLTTLALASTEYAQEVQGGTAHGLMLAVSTLSVVVTITLIVITTINIHNLFPYNDPVVSSGDKTVLKLPTSAPA